MVVDIIWIVGALCIIILLQWTQCADLLPGKFTKPVIMYFELVKQQFWESCAALRKLVFAWQNKYFCQTKNKQTLVKLYKRMSKFGDYPWDFRL